MHDVSPKLKDYPSELMPSERRRPERCDRIALVLQGGGALGAYQAGVYQAMHEAGVEPDWVSGVSIGAINSAIIAGNPPKRRLQQLQKFWETHHRAENLAVYARTATYSARRATPRAATSPASPGSRVFSSRAFPIRG